MKVIHTIPSIAEEASGPTYSVTSLCNRLIAEGHDLSLIALDWATTKNSPRFLKTFPLSMGPRRLGRSLTMKRWLYKQCKNEKIAIVHNHGMWMMSSIYPAWAVKKNKNTQLIQSPRGSFTKLAMQSGAKIKPLFWRWLQKPALENVTCFHATAEAEYHDIRRLGFMQPVAIISNGIDIPDIKEKNVNASRTLLFLGRIHVNKGLDLLLSAWQEMQKEYPEWCLRIVGDDAGYYDASGYLKVCLAKAKQLGLERIQFDKPLYGEDKLKAYTDADLFVLPTYSENFAVTVAESLASGTPVIVTKGAPWSGLVQHNAGWWIDIRLDALVDGLRNAMSKSPNELIDMGACGRVWMKQDFSWEGIAEKMRITYTWLCNRSLPVPEWVRLDE